MSSVFPFFQRNPRFPNAPDAIFKAEHAQPKEAADYRRASCKGIGKLKLIRHRHAARDHAAQGIFA